MAYRLQIVCYGHDRTLLETRRMILQPSYRVDTAATLAELAHLGGVVEPSLIIICHTVADDECRRVIQIARALWPCCGVMSVRAFSEHGTFRDCLPSHFQCDPTPQNLKERIVSLLTHVDAESDRRSA